jgi:hypothetical protein
MKQYHRYSAINLFLGVSLLAFLATTSAIPVKANVISVSVENPGLRGEDNDFFTTVLGNPRDMNDTYDLYILNSSCGDPPARAKWTNMSYANGIWRGTTASVGESRSIFLLNPGWVSTLNIGEDGQLYKINTSYYTQLTFRMRIASGAGNADQAIEWADGAFGALSIKGNKIFRPRSDGQWHIYTFDLSQRSGWPGNPVSALWLSFFNLNAGYLVEIDWARLTPKPSRRISWTGGSGPVNVYLGSNLSDPEQRSHLLVYAADQNDPITIQASDSPLTVQASLPGGTYYARVADGGGYADSAGAWAFKALPLAEILAPSYTSGEDFATQVVGNPWDMNGKNDVDSNPTRTEGIQSYSASNGILTIVNGDDGIATCSEPWPHRTLALNLGGSKIDTTQYKYFTYRYKLDNAPDQGVGSVTRVRWQAQSLSNWPTGRTDDISIYDNGWHTFSVDLSTVPLEVEGGKWGDFPVDVMQIIIHESHRVWTAHLDWAKLTTENKAASAYTVRWQLLNVGGVNKTTIYWDTDRNPANGWASGGYVVSSQAESPSLAASHTIYLPMVARSEPPGAMFAYTVSTSGLAKGHYYYIGIKLEDGYNVAWWYSQVPVRIV